MQLAPTINNYGADMSMITLTVSGKLAWAVLYIGLLYLTFR
jgi:hypothetical protein